MVEASPVEIDDEEELYEDEYHLAQAVADKRKRLTQDAEDEDIIDDEEDEEFRVALEQAKANAEKLAVVNKRK